MLLTVALQLAVVYVPALNALFRTVPLPPPDLALCVGAALVILGGRRDWRSGCDGGKYR